MNVRVISPLNFTAGIFHKGELRMNNYYVRIYMYTNCLDADSQGVAMERLKYFVLGEMDSTIFINTEDSEKCFQFLDSGLNVTTLPAEPVDQLIGIMLFYKLNTIMEGRIVITDVEISSTIGDNIIYVHSEHETPTVDIPDWWMESDMNHCDLHEVDQEIVKINNTGAWRELDLGWPVDIENDDADNTVAFTDLNKDDKR